jgi:hypothetical protein
MRISGNIIQIESDSGKSFLNLFTKYDLACAWGNSYEGVTILAQEGYSFQIIQFDGEPSYQGWLEENCNDFSKITKITCGRLLTVK